MCYQRIVLTLAIILLTGIAFPALGLAGNGENTTTGQNRVVSGNNEFAFELYNQIAMVEKDKNVFLSPFSISSALAMTYAGSRGETERQMARTLHFALPQDDIPKYFSLLCAKVCDSKPKPYQFRVANALWGQADYPFSKDFLELVGKYYQGGFNTVDFAAEAEKSRQIINQWVEDNTAGEIKDLLHKRDVDSLTRLVLTNAIYFKGDWAVKFKPEETRAAAFVIGPERTVDVPFMHQQGKYGYTATDEVEVLELPYAGNDLSMLVLLPDDIDKFSAKLTLHKVEEWQKQLYTRKVDVFLPKFKLETRYGLAEHLAALGMPAAFDESTADFSGMTGNKELFIKKVIHQAIIDVNEDGSKAAASTAVGMNIKTAYEIPAVFKADRPFLFLIIHKDSGSILFMGRVSNPAEK
ncbi:serpin family protein [Anaeroselena agilis]|uniref:Serpin family protein n=1 Tax=Anaeroselena agilis TaxID=3063788 RepID=A0ABU3NUD4_9FIRM|nr:serpin family protein [Selenomonadales bacterium 4137-cl]